MQFRRVLSTLGSLALMTIWSIDGHAQQLSDIARNILREGTSQSEFSGVVRITQGDKVLLERAPGYANIEWRARNDQTTKYRIGSITKQFTATLALLLEEQGKLRLEESVRTYIPQLPSAWSKVTLFHLLTHTSGIANITEFPEYEVTEYKPRKPEELVALAYGRPLAFEPGVEFQYCDTGYLLLGWIIESVTHKPYKDYLSESIFIPLGMKDTGYDVNEAIVSKRASGYSSAKGKVENADYIHMSNPYSAGAIYSTAYDLTRWQKSLYGGKLLSPASLRKMITPYKGSYGFGVFIGNDRNSVTLSHRGSIPGFFAFLGYRLQDGLNVVALSNSQSQATGETLASLSAAFKKAQ
jgi:CubicO group peptidase (beta-lactamase class C family)